MLRFASQAKDEFCLGMLVLSFDGHRERAQLRWVLQAKNHRRRIINRNSLSEFAYILKQDGLLYIVTDVKELHDWQVAHLEAHPVQLKQLNLRLLPVQCLKIYLSFRCGS